MLKDLCRVAHECLIEFLRTSLGLPEGVPGIVMAIHTFGKYLDFHPHLHALVADRLFARSGVFHVMPLGGTLPRTGDQVSGRQGAAAARAGPMLRGWVHSGFNVHRGRRVLPRARGHATARPIHHPQPLFGRKDAGKRAGSGFGIRIDPLPLGMNKKIGRNFEVFTPWDFITAITQHIPDKSLL